MSNRDGPRHWLGIYLHQHRLRVLLDRAGDQLAVVEELRIQAAAGLFSLE